MTYEEYAEMRDKLGLSDYAVSQITHVSRAVLSQWKNGRTSPSKATIERLRKLFNDENHATDITDFIKARPNITDYVVDLGEGRPPVHISVEDYRELNDAVHMFIYAWLMAKRKREKR